MEALILGVMYAYVGISVFVAITVIIMRLCVGCTLCFFDNVFTAFVQGFTLFWKLVPMFLRMRKVLKADLEDNQQRATALKLGEIAGGSDMQIICKSYIVKAFAYVVYVVLVKQNMPRK